MSWGNEWDARDKFHSTNLRCTMQTILFVSIRPSEAISVSKQIHGEEMFADEGAGLSSWWSA